MKISAVINAYNASEFIAETIRSVGAQDRLPDELIIVDDGSTDDTTCIIEKEIKNLGCRATLIKKPNGGQLSCITAGILQSTADLIAVLDGDDLWNPNHLSEAEKVFGQHPDISLYFCDFEAFGGIYEGVRRFGDNKLNTTLAATYLAGSFIGNVTSTLVFNADSIRPFLPIPSILEQEWVIHADKALVSLTCMTGKAKYSSTSKNVRYRVHTNNMHKQSHHKRARQIKRLATRRLFEYFRREFYIPDSLYKCLRREYLGHGFTSKSLRRVYTNAIKRSNMPWYAKIHLLILTIHK